MTIDDRYQSLSDAIQDLKRDMSEVLVLLRGPVGSRDGGLLADSNDYNRRILVLEAESRAVKSTLWKVTAKLATWALSAAAGAAVGAITFGSLK